MLAPRAPAVAGRFYPGDAGTLERDVAGYLAVGSSPAPAIALVAPHAGYMFSGAIAGATYAQVVVPRTAVVLCPNHTGMGSKRSLWASGPWKIPGGEVPIDEPLAEQIHESAGLELDTLAHLHEHALEVQLPFLRARNPQVAIVPICIARLRMRECLQIGQGIAAAIGERKDVLLVASSDMSHYVSADEAKAQDWKALARVEALDAEGLVETVETNDISMCGYLPTTVVIAAAKALGARTARVVRYGNSGEASGDFDRVVGYAGVVIR